MQSLERRLGLFAVVTISISSMVGSGIFVLPGLGAAITGPSLFIAFLLSALTILPAALSKSELATAMPTSGGTYVYIERTFGPLIGTVAGLGLFVSILLKGAFELIGLGAYFVVFSNAPITPTVIVFLIGIIFLNILGVGKVSSLLTAILAITVLSLMVLVGFSIPHWDIANFEPLYTGGFSGLAGATALVFVSFAGVTKVAAIAEEVKDPAKNLPRGILLSLFLVTILYCVVSLMLSGVFDSSQIANNIKPVYMLAHKVGGYGLGIAISVVAVITMINSTNASVLAGSRFPFAMSRDNLLPKVLGKLQPKFLTPVASILLSGIVIAVVILTMDVAKIAKLASAFMIMIYMVENFCVIVLRETRPQWYKPGYKAPLYPFMQTIGIISSIALLVAMGPISLIALVSICVPGLIFYFAYARNKTTRKGVIGIKGKRHDLIEENIFNKHSDFYNIERKSQIVVALFGRERSPDMLVEMGVALADSGNIEVTSMIEVPEQITLQDITDEPAEVRSLRRRVKAMGHDKQREIFFDPIVTHDLSKSIYDISQCVHCEWLLLEWRGKSRGALTIHDPLGWLKSHLNCKIGIFKDAGIRYIKSILVVIKKDSNDPLVLDTAAHFSQVHKAGITIVKWVKSESDKERAMLSLEKVSECISMPVRTKIIIGGEEIKSIVEETTEHELLVFGSQDHTFKESVFGNYDNKLISKSSCSVMAVHSPMDAQTKEKNA
jgi:amino acid transporter